MAQKDLTPAEREAELARREAVLAAREAQLAQEQAELAGQRADLNKAKSPCLTTATRTLSIPRKSSTIIFPSPSIRWTSSSGCCLRSSPCF